MPAPEDSFVLRVRLTPKAAMDRIDGPLADADGAPVLGARVRAAPEKGRANTALEKLLAGALGAPRTAVRVERGATSRLKTVRVQAGAEIRARADALMHNPQEET